MCVCCCTTIAITKQLPIGQDGRFRAESLSFDCNNNLGCFELGCVCVCVWHRPCITHSIFNNVKTTKPNGMSSMAFWFANFFCYFIFIIILIFATLLFFRPFNCSHSVVPLYLPSDIFSSIE